MAKQTGKGSCKRIGIRKRVAIYDHENEQVIAYVHWEQHGRVRIDHAQDYVRSRVLALESDLTPPADSE